MEQILLPAIKTTTNRKRIRMQMILEDLDLGLGPYQIEKKRKIPASTIYTYLAEFGQELKKKYFSTDALVTEVDRSFYERRQRILNQIHAIESLLKKKPANESLIKSLVKLEYILNRIESDRIENYQKLRVIPPKTEAKLIHHSGGYARYNVD